LGYDKRKTNIPGGKFGYLSGTTICVTKKNENIKPENPVFKGFLVAIRK